MTDQDLRYDRMVENALRDVVRQALRLAADQGLPGNHHFYITFRTDHPGSALADHLVERYPGEMTIVLQHQFWGLQVHDDLFEVTLSFNDKPERLRIPFEAVVAFADPSVRFGLQFEAGDESTDGDGQETREANNESDGEAHDMPSTEGMLEEMPGRALAPEALTSDNLTPDQLAPNKLMSEKARPAPEDEDTDQNNKEKAPDGGEVVSLDAFRKK